MSYNLINAMVIIITCYNNYGSIGDHIIASTIKDLHYERYLKIGPKLDELLGKCNLAQFSNVMSSVNP